MQKISLKNITRGQWIIIGSVLIILIIVLIFIFRKVDVPARSSNEEDLKHQLDSAIKEYSKQAAINAVRDSAREKENEDLRDEINSIKGQIKSNNVYKEKIIRELYSADAPQLEQFFTDRYPD